MPRTLPKQPDAPLRGWRDPLHDPPSIVPTLEVNDNDVGAPPREGERQMFEMPRNGWWAMVACYGIFLAVLLGATGGAHATFAIAISLIYVIMFFGTARAVLRQAPPQLPNALDRAGGALQTASGPLSHQEVVGQVLIVPGAVALFGAAIGVLSVILL